MFLKAGTSIIPSDTTEQEYTRVGVGHLSVSDVGSTGVLVVVLHIIFVETKLLDAVDLGMAANHPVVMSNDGIGH